MAIDRIYFDSCVFIESIKESIGTAQDGRENDLWHVKKLLEASRSGDIEVITSYITIAECQGAGKPPDEEVKRLIRSILSSGKVVKLAQLTKATAERARDLRWEHDLVMGGADAVHVATALQTGCKEFVSFDFAKKKSPLKYAKELKALGLIAIEPSATSLLPQEYRQLILKEKA